MKPKPGTVLPRFVMLTMLLGAALVLVFGYLGWAHAAFDSFSHFRIHAALLVVALAPLLLALRLWPEAIFALALGLTAVLHTTGLPAGGRAAFLNAPATGAQAQAGAIYRLLHLNLRYDNAVPNEVLSLIGRVKPDVVTLNEVSAMWVERLAVLEAAYPHRLICPPPAPTGGVAILSRRPFAAGFEPYCGDRGAFGHAGLDLGGQTVEVVTLHLDWPWPFGQRQQLLQIEPLLDATGATVIIAGDFNAAPWSQTARLVEAASGGQLLRGIGPTWLDRRMPAMLRSWIGLPLDNVLVKGGLLPVSYGTLDNAGSDHLPVLVEFKMLIPQPTLQAAVGQEKAPGKATDFSPINLLP